MDQREDMIAYWDFNEPDDDRQAALQHSAALSSCRAVVLSVGPSLPTLACHKSCNASIAGLNGHTSSVASTFPAVMLASGWNQGTGG